MDGHRIEATVVKEGELVLEGIPFHVGDRVEVVIVAKREAVASGPTYPLRGKPVWYDRPFCPVANDDWEAAR